MLYGRLQNSCATSRLSIELNVFRFFSVQHSRNQRFHPDRMKVNSRGRAALREAHGKIRRRIDPVRVKLVPLFDPFRVGSPLPLQPRASRKAARPRLLNLVLSGPEFLLKRQEVNRSLHREESPSQADQSIGRNLSVNLLTQSRNNFFLIGQDTFLILHHTL